jgi:hypothetical protein
MESSADSSKKNSSRYVFFSLATPILLVFIGLGYQNFSSDGSPYPSGNVKLLLPKAEPPHHNPCARASEKFALDFKFGPGVRLNDIVSLEVRLNSEAMTLDHPEVPSVNAACAEQIKEQQTIRICGTFQNIGYAHYHVVHQDQRVLDGVILMIPSCSNSPQAVPEVLFAQDGENRG